jgi:hypothetical protein
MLVSPLWFFGSRLPAADWRYWRAGTTFVLDP